MSEIAVRPATAADERAVLDLASAAARTDAHRFYRQSGMSESMQYTRRLG
jgi:hypothetical protein